MTVAVGLLKSRQCGPTLRPPSTRKLGRYYHMLPNSAARVGIIWHWMLNVAAYPFENT